MHNVIYIELPNRVSAHGGSHPLFFFFFFALQEKNATFAKQTLGVSLAFLEDLHLSSTMVFAPPPLVSLAEGFPGLAQTPCSSANTTSRHKT